MVFDVIFQSPALLEVSTSDDLNQIVDKIYYFESNNTNDFTIKTDNIDFTFNSRDNINIQIPSFNYTLSVNIPINETKLFAISHKHTGEQIKNIFYIYVDSSYHKVILTVSSFSNFKNNILATKELSLGNQTQNREGYREGFNIFDNIVNAFFEVDKFLETHALLRSDKVYSFKKIIERLKPIAIFLLVIVFILLGLPMTLLKEEGTINYNKYFSLFLQKILLYIVIFEEFNGFNLLIDGFFLMMKIFLFGSSSIFSSFSSLSSREVWSHDLFILSSSYDIMNTMYPILNIALIVNVSLAFVYMFISIYFLPVAFIISTIGYYEDLIKKVFEKIISCLIFIFLHNLTYIIMLFILNGVSSIFSEMMGQDPLTSDNQLLSDIKNIILYIYDLVFQLMLHFFIIIFYMTQCSSFIEKLSGFTGVNTMDHASKLMLQIPGLIDQLNSIAAVHIDKNMAHKNMAHKNMAQSDKGASKEAITRDGLGNNNAPIENKES